MSQGDLEHLVAFLGQDLRFWVTVLVASIAKWLLSPSSATRKKAASGFFMGGICAYYGTDSVIRIFDTLTAQDRDIIVILLVLTGEHIGRTVIEFGPEFMKKWAGISSRGDR